MMQVVKADLLVMLQVEHAPKGIQDGTGFWILLFISNYKFHLDPLLPWLVHIKLIFVVHVD